MSANKKIEWEQRLKKAGYTTPTIKAIDYTRGWRTKSEPVLLECEDGKDYVVKGQQAGRQIINDQLVAIAEGRRQRAEGRRKTLTIIKF
ncbi:MAG: hypothetical protein DSM107014_13970 [Gomphosphaeria aponina SAG 52.96 = DSM 107014]|uniref:Uncharacterized protein n=1 Tax=Gomphosphaeria aponina SAG 52.96 = DSM 107014 TaxID=1521640 RepID=A0A941GYU9_9CHRO|nr:hypothetical protein [Gomphosphaeria aponina SAG 52.96 = DSM 107014]